MKMIEVDEIIKKQYFTEEMLFHQEIIKQCPESLVLILDIFLIADIGRE